MPLLAIALGCEIDVRAPQSGVVHSSFERAVNLIMNSDMWTVLDADRPDGPFGIRLAPGAAALGARVGDRVHVRAGYLGVGRRVIDCRSASRWAPAPWPRPAAGLAARLAVVEHAARGRAWAASAAMAHDLSEALHDSDADLDRAVRRSVGRGPGLTPAGDDVLVGILALLTSGAVGAAGAQAARRLGAALAPVLATTPDISRQLLLQALRGLPGRALHDLGQALMAGGSQAVLADAIEAALESGATSGADACLGLAAACRFSFFNAQRLAA